MNKPVLPSVCALQTGLLFNFTKALPSYVILIKLPAQRNSVSNALYY